MTSSGNKKNRMQEAERSLSMRDKPLLPVQDDEPKIPITENLPR